MTFSALKTNFDIASTDPNTAPKSHHVVALPDIDFVYIMRKDTESVSSHLAEKIGAEYNIPPDQMTDIIGPIYDTFVDNLIHTLGKNFQHKGKTEIHLFTAGEIEAKRLSYVGQRTAITLDPLIDEPSIQKIGVSRGYLPGGKIEIGMVARPGYPEFSAQIKALKDKLSSHEAIDIFEDDIFTAGSLTKIINSLNKEGIEVARIIPGIQVGAAQGLLDRGIEIAPVVQYFLKEGQDVDLGDPRDFLVGIDGLVTLLNDNTYGRLPYLAPFVSPHARLSIPPDQEETFSTEVLKLNLQFYKDISESLSLPVKLKHMNEPSANALKTFIPCDDESDMTSVVDYIIDHYMELQANCKKQMYASAFKMLDLPQKLILIDVNGTLIPSDSEDGFIEESALEALQKETHALTEAGFAVGLNSDSPHPQLKEFAKMIGLPNSLIIAENGAVISYGDKKLNLRALDNMDGIKADIKSIADNLGLVQSPDIVAPEFGGQQIKAGQWGFGANRSATLSIFCHDESFLTDVKNVIEDPTKEQIVDCDFSPEYGFFSVHACHNFRKGKAETLEALAAHSHQVVSIGDSMSDYADYDLPNKVVFVQDGLPSATLQQPHVSVSKFKGISGVIEILNQIAKTNAAAPTFKQERSNDI